MNPTDMRCVSAQRVAEMPASLEDTAFLKQGKICGDRS
jgi:hypothetical protein